MRLVVWSVLLLGLLCHQTKALSDEFFSAEEDGFYSAEEGEFFSAEEDGFYSAEEELCPPHQGFVDNHVCAGCNDVNDALNWVQNNGNRISTQHRPGRGRFLPAVTTVFRDPIHYRYGPPQWNARFMYEEDSCEIMPPVQTWDCWVDQTTGQWSICNSRNLCTALSSKGRPGHLWGHTIGGPACGPSVNPFIG